MVHIFKSQIWNYFVPLVFIMAFGLMAYFMFLMFYPFVPLEPKTQPYKILNANHDIAPGETISYLVDVKKNTDVSPQVARKLVDVSHQGKFYTLSTITTSVDKGNFKHPSGTTNVPTVIDCSTYYLELNLTYQINPFHAPIVIVVRTEDFTVSKNCNKI